MFGSSCQAIGKMNLHYGHKLFQLLLVIKLGKFDKPGILNCTHNSQYCITIISIFPYIDMYYTALVAFNR